MKKNAILSFLCFLLATVASAQRGHFIPEHEQPLVVIDTFVTDIKHLLLQPDKIESMNVVKGSDVISTYGEKAKNGIIVIHPKKSAQILKFDQLLNQFNIPDSDRKLNVCINNVRVSDTNKLLADKDDIASVEVITDIRWITPSIPGPEERYINIFTRKQKK